VIENAYLWSYVRQAPAPFTQQTCFSTLLEFVNGAQTKIGYLENTRCVKHYVLWFEVTMADTFPMDIALEMGLA
jgi:hypothetical protein